MTAVVNLTGSIAKAANERSWQQVSSQLLWTLSGSGQSGVNQAVQSVEVELNGHPWFPPGSRATRCSRVSEQARTRPRGQHSVLLRRQRGVPDQPPGRPANRCGLSQIGTGYTQVAVSPDGRYLAALRNGTLYTGSSVARLRSGAGAGTRR